MMIPIAIDAQADRQADREARKLGQRADEQEAEAHGQRQRYGPQKQPYLERTESGILREVALCDDGLVQLLAQRRDVLVELVLQVGELDLVFAAEQLVEQRLLVLAQCDVGLLPPIDEIVVGADPQEARLFQLLDLDDAAPRQVDDRRHDVLHVGALVDQRAGHARRQIGRRLRQVVGDQADGRIAAHAIPPQVEQHRAADEQQSGQAPGSSGRRPAPTGAWSGPAPPAARPA